MKTLKILWVCSFLLTLEPHLAIAQTIPSEINEYRSERSAEDFTDDEIAKFAEVMKAVLPVRATVQAEVDSVLLAEGMTMDSYNALAERIQRSTEEDRPSPEKTNKFARINAQMMEAQQRIQPELTRIVDDSGIGMRDYEDMLRAYREDETFSNKVKAKM